MKITFFDEHEIVQKAVQMANSILTNDNFYARIRLEDKFELCSTSPKIIADLIFNSSLEFKVQLYNPKGLRAVKYRRTLAYTDNNYPNTLFLNLKKIDREIEDIAATIIHESIHALDDECIEHTFGHGNNNSRGKENTAPYWIGDLAYQILKGN